MDRIAAGRRAATKNKDAFNSSLPGRKPPATSEKLVGSRSKAITRIKLIVRTEQKGKKRRTIMHCDYSIISREHREP
jgi:hypothetical protein